MRVQVRTANQQLVKALPYFTSMGVLPMQRGQVTPSKAKNLLYIPLKSVKALCVPMLHFSVDGAGTRLQKGAAPGRARGHISLLLFLAEGLPCIVRSY